MPAVQEPRMRGGVPDGGKLPRPEDGLRAYQQGEISYVDWNIFPQNNYAIRCVRNI